MQDAARLPSASQLNYSGVGKGNDIFSGAGDVEGTDGITGNVALKTMEGLANMLIGAVKTEYTRNLLRPIGALLYWTILRSLRKEFRSAHLLEWCEQSGLVGAEIKSHGSADTISLANAIAVGLVEARDGVPTQIVNLLKAHTPAVAWNSVTALIIKRLMAGPSRLAGNPPSSHSRRRATGLDFSLTMKIRSLIRAALLLAATTNAFAATYTLPVGKDTVIGEVQTVVAAKMKTRCWISAGAKAWAMERSSRPILASCLGAGGGHQVLIPSRHILPTGRAKASSSVFLRTSLVLFSASQSQ